MGINDLQSQVNQLRSLLRRQAAVTQHLHARLTMAEQNSGTTQNNFVNEFYGGGGGGSGTVTSVAVSSPLATGTGSAITTSGTISIGQASSGSNGYLSSTDWSTFNDKGDGTVTEVDAGPGLYTEPEAGITATGTIHINPGTAINLSDPPDSTVDVDIYGAPAFVDDTLDREDAILAADDDDPYQPSKKAKIKELDMEFFTGTTNRLYGTDASGDVKPIAFGNVDQVLTANGTTILPSFKDAAGDEAYVVYAAVLDNNLEFTERTNAGAIQTTTATIQQTNTSTGTLENGTTVNVFSYGGYNGYSTGGQRVQIVKDSPMTSYKGSDWYRVLSDMTQDILVRVCGYDSSGGSQGVGNGIPYVGTTPNGLGVNGTVRVYRPIGNYPGQSTAASAMILYADFTEDYLRNTEGTKTQAVDMRFRLGMVPNQKDMYKAKFWPGGSGQNNFLVVEELYGIMARVVPSTTAGYPPNYYVGVARWYDITPGVGGDFAEWPEGAAMGWFYWMGQRRNIIGQFVSDCDSGDSQQFMLARTKLTGATTNPCTPTGGSYNGTMEFSHEIQHGNAVTNQSGPTVSSEQDWNVTFARGQVYNVAAFKLSGDATLNDGDICAAQYDEESGTYLAAPLRCS